MILEQNIRTIVMLTNPFENGMVSVLVIRMIFDIDPNDVIQTYMLQ